MADKFQLKALITGVDKLSPALNGIRKNIAGFRKGLKADGLGEIGFKDVVAGAAIAAPIIAATEAAIEFESAMADVRKVVTFDTPEQFKQMGDDVLQLSRRLPMAAQDIAKIVAAGGQAGIDRGELSRFAEDAVKMGVAFDQTSEEAGDMMAKWRTAFKLGQDEVAALADKINYLGNTGPANARQISGIVSRIGPLGAVAGLASGEIAAMGATLAGVGVQEEVAATGMQNFMLALSAGSSAAKKQQELFKALRMDAKQVAVSMQTDAQGTIVRVLTAIGKVDKVKQTAVLEGLFGRESIKAIAPMLTNLDLLKDNFGKVGDATKYAGSMQQEYDARAATTQNNLQLMRNRMSAIGIAVGSVLLPPLNAFLAHIGPIADSIGRFASENPELVKGLLGAAAGFVALRGAVSVAMGVMRAFTAVSSLTPLGLAVRVLALAAGFLIANWSRIAPFLSAAWGRIKAVIMSFPPLQFLIENWEPIVDFMDALWEAAKVVISQAWDGIKELFLNFTPLGIVIENWDPIVAWFSQLWDRVRPYIEPLFKGAQWVAGKFGISIGAGAGDTLQSATQGIRAWTAAQKGGVGAAASGGGATSLARQGGDTAHVRGDLTVRFENAPPGLRPTEAKTNQPGLTVSPRVGYRSFAGAT